jgi:hypothetical protein
MILLIMMHLLRAQSRNCRAKEDAGVTNADKVSDYNELGFASMVWISA